MVGNKWGDGNVFLSASSELFPTLSEAIESGVTVCFKYISY